jgi:hypothetical protein
LKRRKYNYWQDKGLSIEGSDIKRIRYSKDQVSKVSNIVRIRSQKAQILQENHQKISISYCS